MKHLKKLSVALLAATLFSVSFTSCIDNEVSPVVEAIYEAQAGLIAAQAKVQDAEAALLMAQAATENAQAALLQAQVSDSTALADAQVAQILANAGLTNAQAEAILKGAEGSLAQALANAGLTDAQAAKILAEVAALEADTAHQMQVNEQALIALVQTTQAAVVASQNALAIAQIQFEMDMNAIMMDLEAAGVQLATNYALNYRNAMAIANGILEDLLEAKGDLKVAELMQNSQANDYLRLSLESNVNQAKLQVEWQRAEIEALEAILADSSSLPAKVTAWKVQLAEIDRLRDLKNAEVELAEEAANNLISGWDGEDDRRDDLVAEFLGHRADSTSWRGQINGYNTQITNWTARKNTWVADKAATTLAVTNATNAISSAKTTLGGVNAGGFTTNSADANYTAAMYLTKDKNGVNLAIGGTKYTGTSLQEVLANAKIDELNAIANYNAYNAGLAQLTASYNAAAVVLSNAQNVYDSGNFDANIATADAALVTAQSNADTAKASYLSARAAFEANPAGSVVTDGAGNHSSGFAYYGGAGFDLGNTGIATDLAPKTYMKVATWKETTIGSGDYIPATYATTKYNVADLAVAVAAIKADVVNNSINTDAQVLLWEDAVSTMPISDYATNPVSANAQFISAANAIAASNAVPSRVYFVEVEGDDTTVSFLYNFNVATNVYGKDDFAGRSMNMVTPNPLTTSGTPISAVYSVTPDAQGEINGAPYALTAQAALWNAKLEVAYRNHLKTNAFTLLQNAQAAFDVQKEMFDQGQATLANLNTLKIAATAAIAPAKKAVDNALVALGIAFPAGTAINATNNVGDPLKTTGDATAAYNSATFSTVTNRNTLTLNAQLFNAQVAKAIVDGCNVSCLQTAITNAQHEINLIQPKLTAAITIMTALRAEYNEIMKVFIDGGMVLDADLQAEYNLAMFEVFKLQQQYDALDAEYDFIDNVLNDINNDDDLEDIRWRIETRLAVGASTPGSIADSIQDLKDAEEALNDFIVANEDPQVYLDYLQALIDTLQGRYDNTIAIANEYKRLMNLAINQ